MQVSELTLEAGGVFTVTVLPNGRISLTVRDALLPQQPEPVSLLDVRQAATHLSTSVRNVRAWLAKDSNPIPHFKINNHIRIRSEDLDSWIKGQRCVVTRRLHDTRNRPR